MNNPLIRCSVLNSLKKKYIWIGFKFGQVFCVHLNLTVIGKLLYKIPVCKHLVCFICIVHEVHRLVLYVYVEWMAILNSISISNYCISQFIFSVLFVVCVQAIAIRDMAKIIKTTKIKRWIVGFSLSENILSYIAAQEILPSFGVFFFFANTPPS